MTASASSRSYSPGCSTSSRRRTARWTAQRGGLGIGLTLFRSLAELHGGSVAATSAGRGQGSEFVVRLPAALSPTGTSADFEQKREAQSTRKFRVLVDDNIDLAKEMGRLLKLSGHDVQVAHSAEDALTIAREHRPEVMLLDIGLPGTDGYELASILRNDEWSKDSVLIAVSGYGEESAKDRSKQAGFNHYLVKPVNFDSVLALIGQS